MMMSIEVIKNENKSVILVTHDISEAIAMGDKVAVLIKETFYHKKHL